MENGIFESAIRSSGDLAIAFECDDHGGYFYLFDLTKGDGQQACAVIEVSDRGLAFDPSEVSVAWNASGDIGGLRIHGDLWAAFDQSGRRYGGSYAVQKTSCIPPEVASRFNSVSDLGSGTELGIHINRH